MCWMCNTESYKEVPFIECGGCSKTFPLDEEKIQSYDLFHRFKEYAEFVNQKRFVNFCTDCIEEMDKYRQFMVENYPMPVSRYDRSCVAERHWEPREGIPVGIHHTSQYGTLGIRCAKLTLGYNAVEEILRGIVYYDEGKKIHVVNSDTLSDYIHCSKCHLHLWKCNAMERTI
jgi:hypothetical protein